MAAKADVVAIAANAIAELPKSRLAMRSWNSRVLPCRCFDLSAASKMTYDRLLVWGAPMSAAGLGSR